MLFLFAPAVALSLSACGSEDAEEPRVPPEELANTIEALRQQDGEEASPLRRIGYIAPNEVGERFRGPGGCRLERNGRTLLIARDGAALARIDDQLRVLPAAGPVSPSGGYFEAPGVNISIGRRPMVASDAEAPGIGWPAGVTVGGREDIPLRKFEGTWRC